MRYVFLALLLLMPLPAPVLRANEEPDFAEVAAGSNQVEGLALPADMKVPADAGLVKIRARCEGDVKFSVLSSAAGVRAESAGKTVVVSIPPTPGTEIVVFAWTVIVKKDADGKLASAAPSELARCNIIVDKPDAPAPQPAPAPKPKPKLIGKGYAVLIHDPQTTTPEAAAVLNSAKLRSLPDLAVRVVDANDPFLKAKNLAGKFDKTPWLIVQNAKGEIVAGRPLPATEAATVSFIQSLRGR